MLLGNGDSCNFFLQFLLSFNTTNSDNNINTTIASDCASHYPISSVQLSELGTIFIPILKKKKMSLGEFM